MKQFLKAQNKTNELVITGVLDQDEIDRVAKSEYHWAERRGTGYGTRTVRKGEIYQFEFGKNDMPEMSYEHRGLVIGVKKRLLYVLPIFSYKPAKHPDVYHPVDNPGSKSDLYLLKKSEFSFITHDSVLKLNDLRTVSVKRILYQQGGRIDPATDTYKNIEALVLQKYFPDFYREYVKRGEEAERLKEQVDKLSGEKAVIEAENDPLKVMKQRPDYNDVEPLGEKILDAVKGGTDENFDEGVNPSPSSKRVFDNHPVQSNEHDRFEPHLKRGGGLCVSLFRNLFWQRTFCGKCSAQQTFHDKPL